MTDAIELPWQRPLGATPRDGGGTTFRVWAPHAVAVAVRTDGGEVTLDDVGLGLYEGSAAVAHGEDYQFVLRRSDGESLVLPDPCSRHQPQGLRGPSRVLDPGVFQWTDAKFSAPGLEDLVLYELHVGTFTAEGTFAAAAEQLPALAELGVNAVEVMPVADFPGDRGWGYDGVYISATHRAYGGPGGLARFVDAAHAAGVAVVLDVVYNHLGASGQSAMEAFGPYFTDRHETFWGRAINYDDADSDAVREWVLQSAAGWVRDFHIDGLRLDAVHAIFDARVRHIVGEVVERVRAVNPRALVIAESALNDPKVIRPPAQGGWDCGAQWADEFHHALRVLLTGDRDGYYADFGRVADLAKAFARPFVFDGGYSVVRRQSYGAPAGDRPPAQFVVFAQNHDQVGNRAFGDRLPDAARPLAAFCTLLSPFTPMLFMGEEYGEPAPFQFFCDHIDPDIAQATREGRRQEFAGFASFGHEIPDPQDPETFTRSKLTRLVDPSIQTLYRDLLRARRTLSGESRVSFDEHAGWLLVARDGGELACNFSSQPVGVPVSGDTVVLGTHEARLHDGHVQLAPLSGALVS
jgi:maltooligosyltrehalose trehalohydrolase